MAIKPENLLRMMRGSLTEKGHLKDIPLDVWYAEFMYHTGYGKKKVREWTHNFHLIQLIVVKDEKVNFV